MKKNGILNSDISKLAADLGHTDCVCIGDCGLPVPNGVKKIDIALTYGSPSFEAVLKNYVENVVVEKVWVAKEIIDNNPKQLESIKSILPPSVEMEIITHIQFKESMEECKAVIRTGEITPFSNIILQSGAIEEFNL
ncbi:D-ribose pyranase [Pseudolactococcus piscium]|nr:D-ribose pyranase [Lactococcus piscium]